MSSRGSGTVRGFPNVFTGDTPHEAAVKGKAVPLLADDTLIRAVVCGIRHHDGFASELRDSGHPSITRALNAREIMSNRVPDMKDPSEIPYCFWFPEVPSEKTLRELLDRYPTTLMRYQVGRACAVAGYTALFAELELLPDVAIAEEARENGHKAIFDLIMGQPTRYAVMDDYKCTLKENPTPGAYLNGDTCVLRTLQKRQYASKVLREPYFDIAEDWNLTDTCIEAEPISDDVVDLLHTPLPFDLPTVDKDFLILMAAWSGNFDRYARLRRPEMINGEIECVVRGIYHDTFFAKWCLKQPELSALKKYVYARFIMNNDLSWATDDVPDGDLPQMFHYPQNALWEVLEELHRKKPVMRQSIACALISCDAPGPFYRIDPDPDMDLYDASCRSENKGFMAYIEEVAHRRGLAIYMLRASDKDPNLRLVETERLGAPPAELYRQITIGHIGFDKSHDIDDDAYSTHAMSNVLLYISARPAIPVPAGYDFASLREFYGDRAWNSDDDAFETIGLYRNTDWRPRFRRGRARWRGPGRWGRGRGG